MNWKNLFRKKSTYLHAFVFLFGVAMLFFAAHNASAIELNYPRLPLGPNIQDNTTFPQLIAYLFNAAVWIAGALGMLSIVIAGLSILTAAGNPSAISDAKDRIFGSFLGIALLFCSFILLQTINPSLVNLQQTRLRPATGVYAARDRRGPNLPLPWLPGPATQGPRLHEKFALIPTAYAATPSDSSSDPASFIFDPTLFDYFKAPASVEDVAALGFDPAELYLYYYCNPDDDPQVTKNIMAYLYPVDDENNSTTDYNPGADLTELECGQVIRLGNIKSWRMFSEKAGVYIFKESNCLDGNGNNQSSDYDGSIGTDPITESGPIPAPFQNQVHSVLVVNDLESDTSPYYGFVLTGIDAASNCNVPLVSSGQQSPESVSFKTTVYGKFTEECFNIDNGPTCPVKPHCTTTGQCAIGGTGAECNSDLQCAARCNPVAQQCVFPAADPNAIGDLCDVTKANACRMGCETDQDGNAKCVLGGEGTSCSSDSECSTPPPPSYGCNDQHQCVLGGTEGSCSGADDTTTCYQPTSCTPDHKCEVNGGGASCGTDSDCVTDNLAAKLKVVKTVINDNGGTKTVADFLLFVDSQAVGSGSETTLDPGSHFVWEFSDSNYTQTIGGDCDAAGNVTLVAGTTKTCTITNDDKPTTVTHRACVNLSCVSVNGPGSNTCTSNTDCTTTSSKPTLTIEKVFVPANAAQASEFAPYKISGVTEPLGEPIELDAGTYTVTETMSSALAQNYSQSFSDACAPSGTVTLAAGDDKVCTIINTQNTTTTHNECKTNSAGQPTCQSVSGSGTNQCNSNSDCTTNTCTGPNCNTNNNTTTTTTNISNSTVNYIYNIIGGTVINTYNTWNYAYQYIYYYITGGNPPPPPPPWPPTTTTLGCSSMNGGTCVPGGTAGACPTNTVGETCGTTTTNNTTGCVTMSDGNQYCVNGGTGGCGNVPLGGRCGGTTSTLGCSSMNGGTCVPGGTAGACPTNTVGETCGNPTTNSVGCMTMSDGNQYCVNGGTGGCGNVPLGGRCGGGTSQLVCNLDGTGTCQPGTLSSTTRICSPQGSSCNNGTSGTTHLSCQGPTGQEICTQVNGAGSSNCAFVGQYCNPNSASHLACQGPTGQQTCATVSGSGANDCLFVGQSCNNRTVDTTHLECQGPTGARICTQAQGVGMNTCGIIGQSCDPNNGGTLGTSHLECQGPTGQQKCTKVNTAGPSSCAFEGAICSNNTTLGTTHLACQGPTGQRICAQVAGAGISNCNAVGTLCDFNNGSTTTHLECLGPVGLQTCSVINQPGVNMCGQAGLPCGPNNPPIIGGVDTFGCNAVTQQCAWGSTGAGCGGLMTGDSCGAAPAGTILVSKMINPIPTPPNTATAFAFPLFVNSIPVITDMAVTRPPGSYVVSEAINPDYELSYSGDCDASGNVVLNNGDIKICILTNTYKGPSNNGALTIALTANPTSINPGQQSTITWSAPEANFCTASSAWSGSKQPTGTEIVQPTTTSIYTLDCQDSQGHAVQSITINVVPPQNNTNTTTPTSQQPTSYNPLPVKLATASLMDNINLSLLPISSKGGFALTEEPTDPGTGGSNQNLLGGNGSLSLSSSFDACPVNSEFIYVLATSNGKRGVSGDGFALYEYGGENTAVNADQSRLVGPLALKVKPEDIGAKLFIDGDLSDYFCANAKRQIDQSKPIGIDMCNSNNNNYPNFDNAEIAGNYYWIMYADNLKNPDHNQMCVVTNGSFAAHDEKGMNSIFGSGRTSIGTYVFPIQP
jgi:hypothetical protein